MTEIMVDGYIPPWQKVRRIFGLNFYAFADKNVNPFRDDVIVWFNGRYLMSYLTAVHNLGNYPSPHDWKVQDFAYTDDQGIFRADHVARLMYCKEYYERMQRTNELIDKMIEKGAKNAREKES